VRVAVLAGGRSSEHDVSLRSGASVGRGLEQAGHEVVAVTIGRSGEWRAGEQPVVLEPGGGLLGADAAFPALHGPFGEDGSIQGLLEQLDVGKRTAMLEFRNYEQFRQPTCFAKNRRTPRR